jgi:DUF971 family protein
MSHEGIRIGPADEAESETEPKLTGDAIHPARVRVDKSGGMGVVIEWKDGHKSSWTFKWLRAACPCATCHEERGKEGRAPGVAKPKSGSLLPMYEAPPRPLEVTPVGNYAVRFKWNDGHEAGLYSWDYLRNVCDVEAKKQGLSAA